MLPCLAALHRRRSSTTDAFMLHVYHNSYSRFLGGGDIIDDKHLHLSRQRRNPTLAPQVWY